MSEEINLTFSFLNNFNFFPLHFLLTHARHETTIISTWAQIVA